MEIVLLLALLSAGICGGVASSKNLNVGMWVVLGLFFGIFAVVAVAVVSKGDAA